MQQINRALSGITSDIDHAYVTPTNWVFPTHGIRVFNRDGKGFVLTNQKGNEVLFSVDLGFTVIAAEEHRGIIYLISVAPVQNSQGGTTDYTQIGCYPYPNQWINGTDGLSQSYGVLHNYSGQMSGGRMQTDLFGFSTSSKVKLIIDDAFDESANLYICDGVHTDKVVNSGFTISGRINGIEYADVDFKGKMNHVLYSLRPPIVKDMLVDEGGKLRPGNYSIFFLYKTSTYDSTEYFAGPQNIFIGEGSSLIESAGVLDKDNDGNQNYVDKKIEITFTDYDPSYKYVSIGIVRFYNDTTNSLAKEEYSLAENYKLTANLTIVINGGEEETFFTSGELFAQYLKERISVDHVFDQGRIWKANLSRDGYSKDPLQAAAQLVTVDSVLGDPIPEPRYNEIQDGTYNDQMPTQDPNEIYQKTGYFEKEAYPFAIIFLLKDGTTSEAFPIKGTNNDKGLHQFKWISELINANSDPKGLLYVMAAEFDLTDMFTQFDNNPDLYDNVSSFYIVRGERIQNMLYDGMWTRTAYGVTMAQNREHSDDTFSDTSGCTSGNRSRVNYRNSTERFFGSEENKDNALHLPIFKDRHAVKQANQYYFPVAAWTNNNPKDIIELQTDEEDKYEYSRAVLEPWKQRFMWKDTDFYDIDLWSGGETAYQAQDEIDHQLYISENKFAIISPDFALEDRHSIIAGEELHMQIYTLTTPDVEGEAIDGYRPTGGAFHSIQKFDKVNDYKYQKGTDMWYEVKAYPINKGVHSGPARFSSYAEDGFNYRGRGKKGLYDLPGYYKMGMEGSWLGGGASDARMQFRQYNRSYQTPPYIGVEPQNTSDFRDPVELGNYNREWLCRLYKKNPNESSYMVDVIDDFLPEYTEYWAITPAIPINSAERKFTVYKGDNFKTKTWLRTSRNVDFDENASKNTKGIRLWGRSKTNSIAVQYDCEVLSAVYCDATYMHGSLCGFVSNNRLNVSYRAESTGKDPDGIDIKYSFFPKVAGEKDAMQWICESSSNDDLNESLIVPAGNKFNQNVLRSIGNDPETPVDDYRKGTRIAFSNRRVAESFADGYRFMNSTSFQDFSTNHGHIQRIESLFGNIMSIRDRAIVTHYVGENKLASADNQIVSVPATIYLAQDETVLAYYGVQQFHGLLRTKDYVYAIDERNKMVWRVGIDVGTTGKRYTKFSNLTEEFSTVNYFDKLFKAISPLSGTPIVGPGCVVGYNPAYKEVCFTFLDKENKYTTVVFNERNKYFAGTSPLKGSVFIQNGDNLLATLHANELGTNNKVWTSDQDQAEITFFGEKEPVQFSFIINGAKEEESSALLEKIYSSLRINCPKIVLNSIDYETERQKGSYTFVTDDPLIYNNAEYIENDWNIPIIRDTDTADNIYEADSEFRGRWLKVTLNYTGVPEWYVRSILSEFDISYN